MRYIRACVYFCVLSIRCFNVVQPETRFHFQSAYQIAKKVKFFKNLKILQNFKQFINLIFFNKKKIKIFIKFQNFQKLHKISKIILKSDNAIVAYFVENTVEKFE